MRTFILRRKEDVSGVSGVGVVAEGVEFEDGQVALSWLSRFHSVEIVPNIKQIKNVHGHGGTTTIEWLDTPTTSINETAVAAAAYIAADEG